MTPRHDRDRHEVGSRTDTQQASAGEEHRQRQPDLFTLALFAMIFAMPGIAWLGFTAPSAFDRVAALGLGCLLAALSTVDWRSYRLPDPLNLILLIGGLAIAAAHGRDALVASAASALAGFAVLWSLAALYRRLRGRDGLGFGDVKLLGAGASWVGITGLPTVVLAATVGALALLATMRLRGARIDGATIVPFGPFLAFGIWIVWLFGPL